MSNYKFAQNRYNKPIVFWALNHRLEKEELVRQLRLMKEKNIGGVILHPRSGLLTPYLTNDFFNMISCVIEEAGRLGIDVWLYDEDPYPSGIAGGQIITDYPEYRAQILKYETQSIDPGNFVIMDIPMEKIVGAYAIHRENGKIVEIRNIRSYMGLLRTEWEMEHKYNTYYPTTYTKANPQNRADTFKPFYRLEWQADDREWDIAVFYAVYCGEYWLYPSYTDMLNPDAIKTFINLTYEPYKARFGKYFGNIVKGFFIDEPKYLSEPLPWTDKLPQLLEDRTGYRLEEILIALVFDFKGAEKIRRVFWDVVQDRFLESFPKQIMEWCEKNGLELIGHCSPEEEPVDQVRYTGSITNFMRTMSIPGTDLITYQVGGEKFPILPMGPIHAASAARQWREGHALCETFGVSEWRLKYSDMIWMINWLYSFGIDIFVFHAFMYSADGYRKMDAGPSEFYQNPQWEYFEILAKYIERVTIYMGTINRKVDTAVLYPFDSWEILFNIHHQKALQCRDEFCMVMNALIRSHCQFDFADNRDFEGAEIRNGRLIIGHQNYSSLVIPPLYYLSSKTKRKIEECSRAGIKIYAYFSNESIKNEIEKLAYKAVSIKGSAEEGFEIKGFVCPENEDFKIYGAKTESLLVMNGEKSHWVFNPLFEEVTVSFAFKTEKDMKVEIYNPLTEEKKIYKEKQGCILIPPRCAMIISAVECICMATGNWQTATIKELSGSWHLKTNKRNILRLGEWVMTKFALEDLHGIDFDKNPYTMQPIALGKMQNLSLPADVCYATYVDVNAYDGRLSLLKECSAIEGKWEIYVNGKLVDNWERSYEYDCMTEEADLSLYTIKQDRRLYRKGELNITVKLHAKRERDGLVQPLYLLGDFSVKLNNQESIGAELFNLDNDKIIYTGSWTDQGYPYYSGSATYTQHFELKEKVENSRYYVNAYAFGSAMKVNINKSEPKIVLAEPFTVDITDDVQEGENILNIEIASTPENMFYNFHAPFGLSRPVWIIEEKSVE